MRRCWSIPAQVLGWPARPRELAGGPPWWPALTRYVFDMHAAWLSFRAVGRAAHPRLRVVFAMLAGLAPLHGERLASRGGPSPDSPDEPDRLTFYDTSSYGPSAIRALAELVGPSQLVYGSDRPVVEPDPYPDAQLLGFDLSAHAVSAVRRVFALPADGHRERAERGEGPGGRTPRGEASRGRTPEVALR